MNWSQVVGHLTYELPLLLFGGVLAAWFASVVLLRAYRRAVGKQMNKRARHRPPEPEPQARVVPPPRPELPIEFIETGEPLSISAEAERLYRKADRARHRAAWGYAAAGAVHALAATVIFYFLVGAGPQLEDIRFTPVVFVVFLWPAVWAFGYVQGFGWLRRVVESALYVLALAAACALSFPDGLRGGVVFMGAGALWTVYMLFPAFTALVLTGHKLRAIGMAVLVFTVILSTGYEATRLIGMATRLILIALKVPHLAEGALPDQVTFFLAPLVLSLALLLACKIILWLVERHEDRSASDQSVVIDTQWALVTWWFALASIIFTYSDYPYYVVVAGVAAGSALALALNWGFTFLFFRALGRKRGGPEEEVRLLLLRIFGARGRSQQLVDKFGGRWRYAGSIQLISADDVATATVQVSGLKDFVTGRFSTHFINNRKDLARRVARRDRGRDLDTRYRINEFFCRDDTWRDAVKLLLKKTDAVLVDLRGFTPDAKEGAEGGHVTEAGAGQPDEAERGIVYELRQLVNLVPLGKLVFIADHTTDDAFLRKTLTGAWQQRMDKDSPNRLEAAGTLRVLRVGWQVGVTSERLLRLLLEAALRPRPRAPR